MCLVTDWLSAHLPVSPLIKRCPDILCTDHTGERTAGVMSFLSEPIMAKPVLWWSLWIVYFGSCEMGWEGWRGFRVTKCFVIKPAAAAKRLKLLLLPDLRRICAGVLRGIVVSHVWETISVFLMRFFSAAPVGSNPVWFIRNTVIRIRIETGWHDSYLN